MRVLFALLAVATFAGCSVNIEDKNTSESYTYDLSIYGCNTGKQTFSSRASYCDGLRSDSRNNGCARKEREDMFKGQNCSGSF